MARGSLEYGTWIFGVWHVDLWSMARGSLKCSERSVPWIVA